MATVPVDTVKTKNNLINFLNRMIYANHHWQFYSPETHKLVTG